MIVIGIIVCVLLFFIFMRITQIGNEVIKAHNAQIVQNGHIINELRKSK